MQRWLTCSYSNLQLAIQWFFFVCHSSQQSLTPKKVAMLNSKWAFVFLFKKKISLKFLFQVGQEGNAFNVTSRKEWEYFDLIWELFVTVGGFSNSCEVLVHLPAQYSPMQVQTITLYHYQDTELLAYDWKLLPNSCNFSIKSLTPQKALYTRIGLRGENAALILHFLLAQHLIFSKSCCLLT